MEIHSKIDSITDYIICLDNDDSPLTDNANADMWRRIGYEEGVSETTTVFLDFLNDNGYENVIAAFLNKIKKEKPLFTRKSMTI